MGLTFDAGALIALERRRATMAKVFRVARERGVHIVVPAPVVAEWWRGRTDVRTDLLDSVHVEPLTRELAQAAGEALAAVASATTIDAIVMASAAQRADTVYTSDPKDLAALHRHFDRVKNILGV
jgi:predicted nucleic acid-binding protein